MSADSIARWNAIPLTRSDASPEDGAQHSLKRPRPDENDNVDGDESEDNISLVSRSPSPVPLRSDAMDVDKYDEYVDGAVREAVTVDTKIKSSNKGFLMLASMGWVEGQPLGLSGDGRVDPVPFYVKNDLTGLGKTTQDVHMIETTVAQRRELDSERQIKETEEQRKEREVSVAKRAALQSEISTTLRAFYCELCDKQFRNVAQYDEHTNSYAHHHKARFRDMQATQRATRNSQEELDKRKEKERKREEKELRKIAKAAGVKMVKPPIALVPPTAGGGSASGGESEPKSSGFKKPGWASVSSSSVVVDPMPSARPSVEPGNSGWATVGAPASDPSPSRPPAQSKAGWAPVATVSQSSSSATTSSIPHQPPAPHSSGPAPAFRTGGWTSLDTGSTIKPTHMTSVPPPAPPVLPPPPPSAGLPPPPSPALPPHQSSTSASPRPAVSSGWSTLPPVPQRTPQSRGGWQSLSSPPDASRHPSMPSGSAGMAGVTPPPPPASGQPSPSITMPPAKQEASRSGWQQFRAGAPGRRR